MILYLGAGNDTGLPKTHPHHHTFTPHTHSYPFHQYVNFATNARFRIRKFSE